MLESDEPLQITIAGGERAPNLERYLESQGVKLSTAPLSESAARAAVRDGSAAVVLIVPPDYAERFAAAQPAPLLLVADSSDSQNRKSADRVRRLLANYGSALAQQRLQVRGVSPLLALPIAVNEVDVATPAGRAVVVLGFMTYFVLFAVLMGGLYLAIDATAGERERGSLEALLSLPVARAALVGGKILATCAYMCLSLAISLTAFVCVFRFVPLERLGMSANLGAGTALAFFAICLPFVPLGATLMTLVASFTRSLSRSADLPHQRAVGADAADRLREHLFTEDRELAHAHPLVESASADDQHLARRTNRAHSTSSCPPPPHWDWRCYCSS